MSEIRIYQELTDEDIAVDEATPLHSFDPLSGLKLKIAFHLLFRRALAIRHLYVDLIGTTGVLRGYLYSSTRAEAQRSQSDRDRGSSVRR